MSARFRGQELSCPARLEQRIVQQLQVRFRPVRVAQVPEQVIYISAFQVRTLQQGVDLAGKEGGGIIMLQVEHDMTAHQAGLQNSASRWSGVHFQSDGQGFITVW